MPARRTKVAPGSSPSLTRPEQEKLLDLRARVETLTKIQAELTEIVRAERNTPAGAVTRVEKTADIEDALEATRVAVAADKDRINALKAEIDGWKDWFKSLTDEEQPSSFGQLKAEIAWRGEEIARIEERVSAGLVRELELEKQFYLAETSTEALRAGLASAVKSEQEDPRLQGLMRELEKARRDLASAEAIHGARGAKGGAR